MPRFLVQTEALPQKPGLFDSRDSAFLPGIFARKHIREEVGILCLARTKTGKMTDKRRQIRLTESVSCAG